MEIRPVDDGQTIGERLLSLRNERGLTRDKVVQGCKGAFAKTTLRDWERGRSKPNLAGAAALARFYGLTLDEFVGNEPAFGERLAVDVALAKTVLAESDPQRLKEMIEPPDPFPLLGRPPDSYEVLARTKALELLRQVEKHLKKRAPGLSADWLNAFAQFIQEE